jgi:hypothetical protein
MAANFNEAISSLTTLTNQLIRVYRTLDDHLYVKRSPPSKLKQSQSENHCIGLIAG